MVRFTIPPTLFFFFCFPCNFAFKRSSVMIFLVSSDNFQSLHLVKRWTTIVAFNSHCTPLYKCLGDPAWLSEIMRLVSWNMFISVLLPLCYSLLVAVSVHLSKVVTIVHFHLTFRGQEISLYAEITGSTFLRSCKLIYWNNASVTEYPFLCVSHNCAIMFTHMYLSHNCFNIFFSST